MRRAARHPLRRGLGSAARSHQAAPSCWPTMAGLVAVSVLLPSRGRGRGAVRTRPAARWRRHQLLAGSAIAACRWPPRPAPQRCDLGHAVLPMGCLPVGGELAADRSARAAMRGGRGGSVGPRDLGAGWTRLPCREQARRRRGRYRRVATASALARASMPGAAAETGSTGIT